MARHSIMVAKTSALLLFVCLVSVGAVDWSTLTPEQLSLLPVSDFVNIKATDLASIPPAACSGFQSAQIAAIEISACSGFTPQQMNNFPIDAANYFGSGCVANFGMDLCAQLNTTFVSLLPATSFAFSSQCIEKMAPNTFSNITAAQFAAIQNTTCSAFSPGLVHNLPPYVSPKLTAKCLKNFTVEACVAMTYNFALNISWDTMKGFSAECLMQMSNETILAFDRRAIGGIDAYAFYGMNRLYLFSMKTLNAIGSAQWVMIGSNLGGATALGVMEVLTGDVNRVDPKWVVPLWKNAQVANYWQTDEFMNIVEKNIRYPEFPTLTWNELFKFGNSYRGLTWTGLALLKPLLLLENIENYNPLSLPGLRTDQIRDLPPQSFQNFTAAQSYYFRNKTISLFSAEQIVQLKTETFANMTKGFKFINLSVISNLTNAQLRALNEKDFEEFTCDQLQQFKKEQIDALTGAAQNRFAELRSKCLSWSDPAADQPSPKLTLIEIVLIGCGSAIIVIAMVIIAVVKIKKNAADREKAPLLGSEETRVNNARKQ